MADKRPLSDAELDGLFQAARAAAPVPSDDLLARIAADAAAQAAPRAAPARAPAPRSRFAGWLAAIGGWPAAMGLATAACAGLAIGLASPEALGDLSLGYLSATGYGIDDLMPSYGDLLEGG